jgi:hypothetical protein
LTPTTGPVLDRPGKISKIENARVSVLPRDVRHLLEAYRIGEGPEREALLTLARQSRERGWWQQYGEAVPEYFQTYVGLEAAASAISAYQAEYVPGLLQTKAYATAVHRAALMNADEGEISKQVAVRMARQHRHPALQSRRSSGPAQAAGVEWCRLGSWGWLISCRAGRTDSAGRVMPDHREVAGAELLGALEPPSDRRLACRRCRVQHGGEQARACSRTIGDWAADSMRSSSAVRR